MTRLLAYIRVILKWRKLIFYNTLAITLLAVGISFILPQRFTATAQLLPPSEEDPLGMSSVLGGGLSASRLSRLRLGGMLGGSTPSDLMVGILQSRSIMLRVAEQCSVGYHYRIRRNSTDETIRQLRRITRLAVAEDGIVSIGVEAISPQLAALIANCYVSELDAFLRSSNMSQGRNMRRFLERRLLEAESSLAVARESLKVFQQRHRTVTVDEETKAAIETYAQLKTRFFLRQAQLAAAEEFGGPDNPYVANLRKEMGAFRSQLLKIEQGGSEGGYGVGFAVSFESLPDVGAEFALRYRDARIQEETYAMLYQQLEYAKVLEARDTPAITVLDHAVPPERKSFPRRGIILLVVVLFSTATGVAFALVSEYFLGLRGTRPDDYRGWQEVSGQIVGSLRRLLERPFHRAG